jgi:hypothetical protein
MGDVYYQQYKYGPGGGGKMYKTITFSTIRKTLQVTRLGRQSLCYSLAQLILQLIIKL